MNANKTTRIWPFLAALLIISLIRYVGFLHDRAFAYALAGIILIVGSLCNRKTLAVIGIDILFVLFTLFLVGITAINGRLFPSNVITVLFFLCAFLYFRSCDSLKELKISVVAFSLLNCALILLQQIGLLPVHGILDRYGLFENSGYASLVCAFAIGIVLEEKVRWRIPLVVLLTIAPVLLMSRTAMIAIALIILYNILKPYGKRTKIIVSAVTAVVCLVALYYLKPLSADSRLLAWVSIGDYMVDNGIWFGKGLGSVARDYMFMQKDFLLSHPESSFRMVADNNYQVYNDYLRILYEGGVITFVIWIAFLISAALRSLKSGKVFFVVPLVAMAFMNVMDIPVVALFSVLALADYPNDKARFSFPASSKAYCVPLAVTISVLAVIHGFGRNTERGRIRELRPALFYAKQLNSTASPENIEKVKAIISSTCCTYEMLTDLSECQLQVGDTVGAVSSLELAYNMIPNKVVACCALLNIYEAQKDTANMMRMAKIIADGRFKVKGSIYYDARKKADGLLHTGIRH